jgi:phosphatidylserine/phosphatidylglycerophosphate/cardiolipin synthase-like enzyme
MSAVPHELARKIYHLSARLPEVLVETLVARLLDEKSSSVGWNASRITDAIPNPAIQIQIEDLLRLWQTQHPEINAAGLALALLTAAHAENHHRTAQALELVWTGPRSQSIPLRRTDQALLQLIQEANERLLIVSFAVYKAKNILDALVQAAHRGVTVSILVESPEESVDKISYDPVQALGDKLRNHARIYVWPHAQRPRSPDGKHGSLHAKAAIADGQTLLISSANLTEYAMNLNMELGVLIRGGVLPGQVEGHFNELMRGGLVVEV